MKGKPETDVESVPADMSSIIAEGKKRFEAWKSDGQLNQNLRAVVLNMNVANGGGSEYDTVKQEYLRSTSVNDKEACLQALGRTRDPKLAQDLLEFVTSEDVPMQDSHQGASAISANNSTRDEVWKFTKNQWKRLNDRIAVSSICMDRWMKMGLNSYSDYGIEEDIADFFKDKDTRAYDRSLVVVSDTIKGNANYKQRDEKLVLEWLQAHGYA
jgi:ERAP1-like C-terminal domain